MGERRKTPMGQPWAKVGQVGKFLVTWELAIN
jgi:hypothetical protein